MCNKILSFMILLHMSAFSHNIENSLSNLIILYLERIHARAIVCVTCWTRRDSIELVAQLNKEKRYQISTMGPENFMRNIEKGQWLNTLFVVDFNCENAYEALLMAGNQSQFTNLKKWLIITNKSVEEVETLTDLYKNVKLRLDSDVKFIVKENIKGDLLLYDMFNAGFDGGGQLKLSIAGKYRVKDSKLELDFEGVSYENRKNLSDVLLRMAAVPIHKPENQSLDDYMENPAERRLYSHSKFAYRMCKYLKQMHGFSNKFVLTDSFFGNLPNGTDGGVSKLIYEDVVDLSCSCTLMKGERFHIIGILIPHYPLRSMFVFRNMGHHALLKNEFLKPFSDAVWISCLFCIFIISVSLKANNWFEKVFMNSSAECSWVTAFLITVTAFMQKEMHRYPTKTAGRIVNFTLMTLVFILYNFYTSEIVASLINTKSEPIKTFEDLTETKYACYVEKTPYINYVVRDLQNQGSVKFFEKKVKLGTDNPHFETIPAGIANVKKGGYAYHTEDTAAYSLIEKTFEQEQICQLEEITLLGPAFIPLVIQRHSQYTKMFKVSLRKMETAGIIRKEIAYWKPRKPICFSGMKFIPVGIEPIFMAFLTYFILIIFSVLILLAEIMYSAVEKRRTEKRKIILVKESQNKKQIKLNG